MHLPASFLLCLLFTLGFPSNSLAHCDLPVHSVSDGDTFSAYTVTVVSSSVIVREKTGFRLLRVRTPERKESNYAQAKAPLEEMIGGKLVEVKLPTKGRIRDRWGRLLVEVYLCDGEKRINVNDQMLSLGWTSSGK